MIVLDTNVVSELMRPQSELRVIGWVDEQPTSTVHVTAVTTAELRYAVARLADGHRKTELTDRIERTFAEDFTGRVLAFDDRAAVHYADIVTDRERRGLPISMADAQIAAICRNHGARLATRNTRDFAHTGIEVLNPWTEPPD
jgi:predicted nucleic acid-binding protein